MMTRSPGITAALALLVVLVLLPLVLPKYYVDLVTQMMIYAIFAMSLDILLGYTGLPSLGHAASFGISAYTVGIVSLKVTSLFFVVMGAALGASLALSALLAVLAIRSRGVYFLMITLALAQLLWGIAFQWRSLTGGDDGLTGIRRPGLGVSVSFADAANFYYLVLVFFVLVVVVLSVLVRSPFGNALRGIRESESRMASLGYNVWLYKFLAFVIAGTVAGVAGMLAAYHIGYISPADLGILLSAKVLLMVILGGAGTLIGPALGAALIVLLENFVSAQTERWTLVLGAIYVSVVLFAPHGILGTLKLKRRQPAAT